MVRHRSTEKKKKTYISIKAAWDKGDAANRFAYNGHFDKGDMVEIRRPVIDFALAMEKKLQNHDSDYGERGWLDSSLPYLTKRIESETVELEKAIANMGLRSGSKASREWVKRECADVANFAMMIFDLMDQESE